MDGLPDALERLTASLEVLERRVYALEHPSEAAAPVAAVKQNISTKVQSSEVRTGAPASGIFAVLGRAMLGMAGAYLLRAVAEASLLPRPAVAGLAIAYAILWLVWAARVPAGAWFASITYACTSALILAPMLWELTLRFKVMPVAVTAGVLGVFVIAATALGWRRNVASVLWIANLAAAAVALALSIATLELTPFIAVLLLMALICEYAAGRNREVGARPVVALGADLGVWALIYIYASPVSSRPDYPVIGTATLLAPGLILFLIYGTSVIFKTVVSKRAITVFETVQTMVAFLLAACGWLYFGPVGSAAGLGVVCLALSAAGYAAVFAIFDLGGHSARRNYVIFACWSTALLLAGGWLCMPPLWFALCLGLASIICTVLGVRLTRLTLEIQGMVYLVVAAAVSGLLGYVLRALAGTLPGAPSWSICFVAGCAALCYAAGRDGQRESWKRQILFVVLASVAISAIAAMLVESLMGLAALSVNPGPQHIAFLRTLTLCAAALALAFCGSHWRRKELTWMGYAMLALVAVKMVFEDLRLGHLEFIAASIFLFAVTLIAVHPIARMGQKTKGAASA
ncbi:MAG: hypothetical protein ABSF16_15030 [Terracidiphilus sp.]|jgi:hypothetical protein